MNNAISLGKVRANKVVVFLKTIINLPVLGSDMIIPDPFVRRHPLPVFEQL